MKIPFLNIWITQTDWEFLYNFDRGVLKNERRAFCDYVLRKEKQLAKYQRPRDDKGRYVSKKKTMDDLLRAEQAARSVVDWNELKQAVKQEEFDR
jgi:hypothetical protein